MAEEDEGGGGLVTVFLTLCAALALAAAYQFVPGFKEVYDKAPLPGFPGPLRM